MQQAREFTSVAGVTGIVLTKLDGTAKGGIAVAIANDLKLPIRYVGVGEGIDDLIPFSAQDYVDALFQEKWWRTTVRRTCAGWSGRDATTLAKADARWMRRALEQARRGLGRTTPNPIVGACVVTDEGVVVGDGAHERAGEPHAEVHALEEAGERARGATLYCTLEPCSHTGRTGPCTERIIAAGIRRVVAAMEDPFPLVSGRGFAALRAHGIEVDDGLEREAAVRLNQPFLTTIREGRPFVILKAATSIDGRIAAAPGRRTPLTSAAANRHAQYHRAQVDAIAVGSETIARRRPAAHRAGGVPRAATDASGFRPSPAHITARPALLDAFRRTSDNSDDARGRGYEERRAVRARAERRERARTRGPRSATRACEPCPLLISRASCSREARRSTRRRGTKASLTTSNCTWRRSALGTTGVPLLDGRHVVARRH